mmetsp:Transcript_1384/g.2310  ORF Transcript_1384/g.2310 Transcript_1384/m.2310 type:complete len:206 (-) Transcript_1384:491-1108(-)
MSTSLFGGLDLTSLNTRLAMDAQAVLHRMIIETIGNYGTRLAADRHAHTNREDILRCGVCNLMHLFQVVTFLRGSTCHLVNQDYAGNSARLWCVLNRDIIAYYKHLAWNSVLLGLFHCHTEIEPISSIVLHNDQASMIVGGDRLDRSKHCLCGRARKDISRNCRSQHTFANPACMGWIMTAASSTDQSHFVLLLGSLVIPHNDLD